MAYVYIHTRLDTNDVFYVGISKNDDDYKRSKIKNKRNKHWLNIVNKTEYKITILLDYITFDEAIEKEKHYIEYFGRKDLGKGTLVNMTDGGEGTTNREPWNKNIKGTFKHTDETKKIISEYSKLKKNNLNKIHSEESKKKMSLAHSNRYKDNREKYLTNINKYLSENKSIKEISIIMNLCTSSIRYYIKTKNKNI